MKVILLAADFPPSVGGVQRYAASLAEALVETGVDAQVIATAQPEAAQFDADAEYEVVRVAGTSKRAVWRQMKAAAVKSAAGQSETAVVATKWFPEGPAAIQAAREIGGPSAMIGHDREFALHGLNLVKWGMQKWVLGGCDIVFVTTGFVADQMSRLGVGEARIRKLGGGLDAEYFYPDPEGAEKLRRELGLENAQVICTVSRLAPHKGHKYVMEALPLVIEEVPQLRYVIVGEGPYRPRLEQHARDYGVREHVLFAGRVPFGLLRPYYTMADVMIMATFDIPGHPTEGFGLSFLEANACGTPVIGTYTGGIPEAVEDGVSGLLVPPCDDEAIAEALLRLLTDREYARLLGEQGRQRALTEFSWDHVARRLMEAVDASRA